MAESARPGQVTLACAGAGIGATLILLSIASVLSDWPPTRLRFDLAAQFGDQTDSALSVLRLVFLFAAVGCVLTGALAVYTARRNHQARIALTIVLPLTALASAPVGRAGLLFVLMTAPCVVWLWGRDARAWFVTASGAASGTDRTIPPPPAVPATSSQKERPPAMSTQPPDQGPQGQPPPPPPPGQQQPPSWPQGPQGQQGPPYPGPAYPGPGGPPQYGGHPQPYGGGYGGYGDDSVVPHKRPGSVTAAAVITIVMSAIAALGGLLVVVAYLVDREGFSDGVASSPAFSGMPWDPDDVATAIFWMFVVISVLALIALVVAIQLLRGSGKMRVPMVILAALTILIGILTLPLGLVWSAAAIAVIILLFSGGAGAWFDSRGFQKDSARSPY